MRWLISLAVFTATPALAGAPQCAIQGTSQIAEASSSQAPPGLTTSATTATSAQELNVGPPSITRSDLRSMPQGLAGLPFAQHVAASGATLFDLGNSHGMRLAAARSDDEFRIFSIRPDGRAAVEGAPVELGVEQLTMIASGKVTPLGETAGFTGYFVRSGAQFQVFYASPDNMVLVPGILRDAMGNNLTRQQVAKIPGAIPTVEVAGDGAPSSTPSDSSSGATPLATPAVLEAVARAAFATLGPSSAPQLFMLVDPQCIYSVRSYQIVRHYAEEGKIRLSVIPLSVLDYEDNGQSTKSALALLSKPADQILTAWQVGDVAGPVSPDASAKLRQNMAIADAIGMKGTPTFIWHKTDGSIGRIDGVPTDISALITSVGS